MANFLLIDKCPMCQSNLYKARFESNSESYLNTYTYECQSCLINKQSRFEVLRHEGYIGRIEYANIIVQDINLTLYYDKNYAEISKVILVPVPTLSFFNSNKDIISTDKEFTFKHVDFQKLPMPKIDLQSSFTEDELYQRIKVWMTFT